MPGHRVAGNVGQCGRTKEVSCQPWNVPGSDHSKMKKNKDKKTETSPRMKKMNPRSKKTNPRIKAQGRRSIRVYFKSNDKDSHGSNKANSSITLIYSKIKMK